MRGPWIGALLLLVSAPVSVWAQEQLAPEERFILRVEYLWWSPQPQGELQKGLGEFDGTLLDVQSDLGMESQGGNSVRGAIRFGRSWKLVGGWTPLDYRGDQGAQQPFVYGTLVARVGDRIITAFKGNLISTALEWDFVANSGGYLGALAGVKYFDVDTVMVNAGTSSRVAETETLPIPVLGLAGRGHFPDWFSFQGELAGEWRPVRLFTTVTRQGVGFLWPVPLADPETGKVNSWHASALDAAERAKNDWIRMAANSSLKAYDVYVAAADLGDPAWPTEPFQELLRIGFRDHVVDREDHPLIARLRGSA